jgi:hypothetical protein
MTLRIWVGDDFSGSRVATTVPDSCEYGLAGMPARTPRTVAARHLGVA